MKENKLVAVYGRVSTSNQEHEKTIETQLSAVNELAQEKGYSIVQKYLDEGWSGDNIERPQLDQLRMDAKKGLWDAVLIYDPDRLARRYSLQELVMDQLREAGIEVIFVTIPTPKNSEEKILYGVRGLFAEYERAKIAERFRLGKKRKVEEGHVLTTEAPYGYRYIRNDKEKKQHGYYEIVEEEARVVRMMFIWVGEEKLTMRSVVRRLQKLGIKPKRSKRDVWSTSTLSTLFRNKAYIGEAHYGSTYAVVPEHPQSKEKFRRIKKSSRKNRPESEWIASKIPVPAIVTKELFAKARTQIETNFALCQRNTKNEYLLGSRIFCSCGTKRNGEGPQHGKHLYYRCSNRVYSFPLPRTCYERGINARITDRLVWDGIDRLLTSPDLLLGEIHKWKKNQKDTIQSSVGDIEAIKKEIAKLKTQQDRYNRAYGAEVLTLEQLKGYTAAIRSDIASLESQIRMMEQQEGQMRVGREPTREEIEALAERATKKLKGLSFNGKRGIVRDIVEKVIGTQLQVEVSGAIPLTTLNYVEYKTEGRNRRTAERGEIHAVQGADQEAG